ncbi:hypothetical protein CLF_112971, partial [Clonorchis sinensis]
MHILHAKVHEAFEIHCFRPPPDLENIGSIRYLPGPPDVTSSRSSLSLANLSDNNSWFTSSALAEFYRDYVVTNIISPPFHPGLNGQSYKLFESLLQKQIGEEHKPPSYSHSEVPTPADLQTIWTTTDNKNAINTDKQPHHATYSIMHRKNQTDPVPEDPALRTDDSVRLAPVLRAASAHHMSPTSS